MDNSQTPSSDPGDPVATPESTTTGPIPSRFTWNSNVALLWVGQLISTLGDWCLWIAMQITIYNVTNSRIDLAFTVFTEALPFLIFSPIAGVVVDRMNRKSTMIAADLGRAGMVALLLIPRGHVPLWLYYAVLFACSAMSAFFGPARIAIMTQLVPRRSLVQVNAALATAMELGEIAGPALGGFVLAMLLQRGAFAADVISFLLSALCLSALNSSAIALKCRQTALTVKSATDDILYGVKVLFETPIPRGMLTWWNLGYFATAIFNAMLYAFARDVLHSGSMHFGDMMSYIGAGLLVGGVSLATVLHRFKPNALILSGLVMSTVSAIGIAVTHAFAMTCVSLFLFGMGGLLVNVTANTLVQTVVPSDTLGRYYGAFSFLARIAQLVGTAIAGPLATYLPLSTTYLISAAIYLLSTVAASRLLSEPVVSAASRPASPAT
jgi:MFS family permease